MTQEGRDLWQCRRKSVQAPLALPLLETPGNKPRPAPEVKYCLVCVGGRMHPMGLELLLLFFQLPC